MAKSVKKVVSDQPKRGRKTKTLVDLQEDINSKRLSIRSIMESGNVSKLRTLEPLFSKAMADELGVNHGSFLDKFRNPIKFSTKDVYRFSFYIGFPAEVLNEQINLEINGDLKLIKSLREFNSISDMKQYNKESQVVKEVKKK